MGSQILNISANPRAISVYPEKSKYSCKVYDREVIQASMVVRDGGCKTLST